MTDVAAILRAMRADCVPAGESGRWRVEKVELDARAVRLMETYDPNYDGRSVVPPGSYTKLGCLTSESVRQHGGREAVMNDFPPELRKHLQFVMLARGRVLVGGLGLGCVVRGLLARGCAESIDVVERSPDVIALCAASVADPRVRVQQRDALDAEGGPWDWAWWDLWSDPDHGEPHLQVTHMRLVREFQHRVRCRQGCWAMPRHFHRRIRAKGVGL